MDTKKDRETKELKVDKEPEIKDSNKEKESAPQSGGKPDNSFYERAEERATTSWYKDWRGKTLGITFSILILFGVGIPVGMAATKYFENYNGDQTIINIDDDNFTYEKAKNDLDNYLDQSYISFYNDMQVQGYVSEDKYDSDVENATDNADDTIKTEKESLESTYGNTWEDEWGTELDSYGYSGSIDEQEQQYKDSLIADELKTKITTVFNSNTTLFTKTIDDPSKFDNIPLYVSSEDKHEGYSYFYYVNNLTPAEVEGTLSDEATDFYMTPENLIHLYVLTYQPIIFTDSIAPFTPQDTSGTNSTDASTITVTNDDIYYLYNFVNAYNADGSFNPAPNSETEIQSMSSLSLSSSSSDDSGDTTTSSLADVSVYASYYNNFGFGDSIVNTLDESPGEVINQAFINGLGVENASVLTATDIDELVETQRTDFGNALKNSLLENGLINGKYFDIETGEPDSTTDEVEYRNFATKYNNPEDEKDYAVYVDVDGLHVVGELMQDDEIVVEYLNELNNIDDSIETGFKDSFNTWLTTNFDYILFLNDLISLSNSNSEDSLDEEQLTTLKEYSFVFWNEISIDSITKLNTKYNEAKTYYTSTNKSQYDQDSWTDSFNQQYVSILADNNNLYQFSTYIYDSVFGNIFASNENETIIIKGDDE